MLEEHRTLQMRQAFNRSAARDFITSTFEDIAEGTAHEYNVEAMAAELAGLFGRMRFDAAEVDRETFWELAHRHGY